MENFTLFELENDLNYLIYYKDHVIKDLLNNSANFINKDSEDILKSLLNENEYNEYLKILNKYIKHIFKGEYDWYEINIDSIYRYHKICIFMINIYINTLKYVINEKLGRIKYKYI